MDKDIKTRENRARRQLARQGYRLHKSRGNGCVYSKGVYVGLNPNDHGGYMIVDTCTNGVMAGERFDLSLEDVERLAAD